MGGPADLTVLRGVALAGRVDRFDLSISAGLIASITDSAARDGGFALPLMSDAHVHLDKTFVAHRLPRQAASLLDAIEIEAADKASWDADDVRSRASRALRSAYEYGTGRMRSHVDWTEPKTPIAWPVLNELRAEWRGRIELQLAALVPLDLVSEAGESIAARVSADGGVLGAFVYRNADLPSKVARAFDLAERYHLALDFHVDEELGSEAQGIDAIIEEAAVRDFAGRVLCGHVCALSVRPVDDVRTLLERLGAAGVALCVLPTTNASLQDRTPGRTPRRRGIAPLQEARAAGVPVILASDNCRDAFYPWGDYDLWDVFRAAVPWAHLEPSTWLSAITDAPRNALRRGSGLRRGRSRGFHSLRGGWYRRRRQPAAVQTAGLAQRGPLAAEPGRRRGIAMSAEVRIIDWAAFRAEIEGVRCRDDSGFLEARSRDYFWYSPILNEQLEGLRADLVVIPRTQDEVVRVAAAVAHHRIPLTLRGGGTGNYGQCVPLEGGVVMDLTGLDRVIRIQPGEVRVEAGARISRLDDFARENGQELLMYPSTRRLATIGGFLAGGSGGVGSLRHGMLRDPGNVKYAKVVTVERQPRVIELHGQDIQKVHHAYGTNGIVVELVVALTRATDWNHCAALFDGYGAALCFAMSAQEKGLDCYLLTPVERRFAPFYRQFGKLFPDDRDAVFAMVAPEDMQRFRRMAEARNGRISFAMTVEGTRHEQYPARLRVCLEPHHAPGAESGQELDLPSGGVSAAVPAGSGAGPDGALRRRDLLAS